MNAAISILMILQLVHVPILCPDLDGECRGVPIESLAEGHAWHVVLLGVLPNDDVDRGPIRSQNQDSPWRHTESPFGDPAMIAASHTHAGDVTDAVSILLAFPSRQLSTEVGTALRTWHGRWSPQKPLPVTSSRSCVLQV